MGIKRKSKGQLHTIVVSDVLRRMAEDVDVEKKSGAKHRAFLEQQAKELEGLEVDVVYEGVKLAKRWADMGRRVDMENNRALAKARKGMSKDLAPEMYDDDFAPPGAQDRLDDYIIEVLKEAVRKVRGVDDHDELAPPAEHAELLNEFGLGLVITQEASKIQSLLKSQSFS